MIGRGHRPIYLLHHLLEQTAQERGDAICLVDGATETTYAQLLQQAWGTAAILASAAVKKGDRVALLAYNSAHYVAALFGISKVGATAVPLNTAADGSSLAFFLADSGARVLIAGAGMERSLHKAFQAGARLDLLIGEVPLRKIPTAPADMRVLRVDDLTASHQVPDIPMIDQDRACIIYTSGSTGRPRGATLTHRNCIANVQSVLAYLPIAAEDSILAVLPFYYIYGQSVLLTHIAAGACIVIENGFMYPHKALDNLEHHGCTGLSGVPSTFAILLNRTNFAERPLASLKYVTQAGGAMSPALTRRLMESLPGKDVYIMYGATEAAGRLSYVPPDVLKDAVGCIGRAIDNVELRVIRDDGSSAEPGEVGEIVARGSCIMQGYWNDPEETAAVLDASGYHTGDLGRVQKNGFLAVVGRKKDMIKAGGHRISSKEIEESIAEHEGVHEVAVVGVPDEILGEAILAYVVPRSSDFDLNELTKTLGLKLPQYKQPQRIIVARDLPKNASGKILKAELRESAKQG